MTPLLTRLVPVAVWGIVRLVAAGLVLLVRVLVRVLGLLALAGLRGARLGWLMATVAGVAWAAPRIGLRPALALATLGWLVWAIRRPGAPRAQRAELRRLSRALETHTRALRSSAPHHAKRSAHALPNAPRLALGQTPEQTWRALERHASAWTRRHTHPAPDHEHRASASDREGR